LTTTTPSLHAQAALRRLHAQLGQQRWRGLGLALQVEVLALFAIIAAFVFWQARLAFAAAWFSQGPRGALLTLAGALAALTAACAVVAGVNANGRVRRSPLRTLWLSLPFEEHGLAGHIAWDARMHAAPLAALFPILLLSASGYTPPWTLMVAGIGFGAAFLAATRAASALGPALAPRERERPLVAGPPVRALLVVRSERGVRPRPAAAWARHPAWLTWWAKDAAIAWRRASGWLSLLLAGALALGSSLVWIVGPPTWPRYLIGLTAAVAAAIVFAEWVVALAGHDPFVAVRSLPLSPASVWSGRFLWVVLFTLVLLIMHLGALGSLRGPARSLYALWLGGASLGIGTLAVNYGVTLFPNARIAQRLLGLAVGFSLLALFVLPPFSGPIALGWALLHSARRLPRWHRLEEE